MSIVGVGLLFAMTSKWGIARDPPPVRDDGAQTLGVGVSLGYALGLHLTGSNNLIGIDFGYRDTAQSDFEKANTPAALAIGFSWVS